MPKDRRLNFLSSDRARASPYDCSSKDSEHDKLESSLPDIGHEQEWEEARCPICMEHPHNAVLLLCSSGDKGCHPYICDTSERHSNCLDQFCKSFAGEPSTELQESVDVARMQHPRGRVVQTLLRPTRATGEKVPELLCPLCRGQIIGWVVVENARCYMNSKVRSCSLESCNFTGNYSKLRRHARHEHPSVKPSDVDPERQSEWERLERERDLGDTVSAIGIHLNEEESHWGTFSTRGWHLSEVERQVLVFSDSDLLPWGSYDGMSDSTEDEWHQDGDISVDLDVGVEFTFSLLNDLYFSPSDGVRNTSSARTGNRSFYRRRSMRTRSRENHQSVNTPPRRQNTTPASSGSREARIIGSEMTGGRSLNRISSIRSRSRSRSRSMSISNHHVETTVSLPPRRWDTTRSRSGRVSERNTGTERTVERSVGRRSTRTRSTRVEVQSSRGQDAEASRSGSEWGWNTAREAIDSRSPGHPSMPSRSWSNHQGQTTTSNRRRRSTQSRSRSGSWRYAE